MNNIRVIIGGFDGPSIIQNLTMLGPDVASVISVAGLSDPLKTSAAYDAFVRGSTGPLKEMSNHSAFRMEVDQPIPEDQSWQLAAFLAHGLRHRKALAKDDAIPEEVFWAAGAVEEGLTVKAISQVAERLQASLPMFADLSARGIPVTLVLHPDNAAEVGHDLPASCRVVSLESLEDLSALGLISKQTARGTLNTKAERSVAPDQEIGTEELSPFWRGVGMGIAVLLMVSLAFPFWQDFFSDEERPDIAIPEPAQPLLRSTPGDVAATPATSQSPTSLEPSIASIRIFEERVAIGKDCGSDVPRTMSELSPNATGFETPGGRNLCSLSIRFQNDTDKAQVLLLEAVPEPQEANGALEQNLFSDYQTVQAEESLELVIKTTASLQQSQLAITAIIMPEKSPLLERWRAGEKETQIRAIQDAGGSIAVYRLRFLDPP